MGFWNFFKSKKKDESENDESSHQNIGSIDLIFAENFTKSGGRFIFIDEINSTKEVFEKIFEENQWDSENVCSLNANVAKNLDKYEMIVQADEYEREQNKVLQSFFDSTKDSFTHPEVHAWANVLWNERDKRLGNV